MKLLVLGAGGQVIVLQNEKGARLTLSTAGLCLLPATRPVKCDSSG